MASISPEHHLFHYVIAGIALLTLVLSLVDRFMDPTAIADTPRINLGPAWFCISGVLFTYSLFSLCGAIGWKSDQIRLFLIASSVANAAVSM